MKIVQKMMAERQARASQSSQFTVAASDLPVDLQDYSSDLVPNWFANRGTQSIASGSSMASQQPFAGQVPQFTAADPGLSMVSQDFSSGLLDPRSANPVSQTVASGPSVSWEPAHAFLSRDPATWTEGELAVYNFAQATGTLFPPTAPGSPSVGWSNAQPANYDISLDMASNPGPVFGMQDAPPNSLGDWQVYQPTEPEESLLAFQRMIAGEHASRLGASQTNPDADTSLMSVDYLNAIMEDLSGQGDDYQALPDALSECGELRMPDEGSLQAQEAAPDALSEIGESRSSDEGSLQAQETAPEALSGSGVPKMSPEDLAAALEAYADAPGDMDEATQQGILEMQLETDPVILGDEAFLQTQPDGLSDSDRVYLGERLKECLTEAEIEDFMRQCSQIHT